MIGTRSCARTTPRRSWSPRSGSGRRRRRWGGDDGSLELVGGEVAQILRESYGVPTENTEPERFEVTFEVVNAADRRVPLRNLERVAEEARCRSGTLDITYKLAAPSGDGPYLAQNEKDQALSQYVQALRGYWQAYYRLRRMTLFDFERGEPIQ